MIYLVTGLIIAIFMQAFFSGIETGLVSIMRPRIKHRADAGDNKAALIDQLLKNPGRLLATTLIGTNICIVCSSVLAGAIAIRLIDKPGLAILVASAILTCILMTFEIIPKNWFRQAPEERCTRFASMLYLADKILGPAAFVMSGISSYLINLTASGRKNSNALLLRNDFRLLLRESEDGGMLSSKAADILDRAIDFHGQKVGAIMTPSSQVMTVQADWSVAGALKFCREKNISRAPVCLPGDQDNWIGIFSIYNVFFKLEESQWQKVKVNEVTSPASMIKASNGIHDVAAQARNADSPLLFVVSDQQTQKNVGVITPTDVAESLFGPDLCVNHHTQE
jgi:magnesium and cobalt exporter, CNNM family